MLVVGPLFQISAFLVQFLALPFPAFVLSFFLGGIGMVFQVSIIYLYITTNDNIPFNKDASANGFIATLQKDSEYKMGFIHAAYGNVILRYVTLTH